MKAITPNPELCTLTSEGFEYVPENNVNGEPF